MCREEFWWYDVRDTQYKLAFSTEAYMTGAGVAFNRDLDELKEEVQEALNDIAGMDFCD